MTDAQLAAELALPAYAGLTAAQKVAALNAPKDGVTFSQIVPKSVVLQIIGLSPFRAAALSEPGRTGWLESLANIRALEVGLNPSDAGVAALLAQAVNDGVLTAEEVGMLNALGVRDGSRAEELWGEGVSVSLNDVALVS